MGEDRLSGLLLIVGLTAAHALFTLAHAALVNARTAWLREQADEGNARAEQVIRLTTGTTRLTMAYQLLTTLLRFVIAGVAVLGVGEPLAEATQTPAAVVIGGVVLLTALFTVIFGDLVPESVGSVYANSLALWVITPMRALVMILSPVVAVVIAASKLISSIVGSEKLVNTVTEEEIMTLVDAGHTGGTIEDEEKEMIYSVLQLDQTRASEVMVPRLDVVALEISTSLDDASKIFIASGYSRIPVYQNSMDQVKGLLYAKDMLAYWHNGHREHPKTIRELMRPAYFVPETKPADELLKEMQTRKVHLAIVVDEYGGTAGIVTIENIIEEIIGDIVDEYDLNETPEYEQIAVDEYRVDASIDLDDFNDLLDVELPTDESDTLGGYIYSYFGRVPEIGEVIDEGELFMRVVSVEGRRIRQVYALRKRAGETPAEDSGMVETIRASQEMQQAAQPIADKAG